jgi:uridine kinase
VRTGEHVHIIPYQEEANLMFNSALPFELNALKPLAMQALAAVKNPELRGEAKRLRDLLASVLPLPAEWTERHICPTSIFREFVGGSLLIH